MSLNQLDYIQGELQKLLEERNTYIEALLQDIGGYRATIASIQQAIELAETRADALIPEELKGQIKKLEREKRRAMDEAKQRYKASASPESSGVESGTHFKMTYSQRPVFVSEIDAAKLVEEMPETRSMEGQETGLPLIQVNYTVNQDVLDELLGRGALNPDEIDKFRVTKLVRPPAISIELLGEP